MAQPPGLPQSFPCMVKAIYSWGGESKRDLGFIEGDLIECLNAGDGSWWMGRLRRDKRVMGLFPSNFVEVLDQSFRPASRGSSPLVDRSPSPNPFNPQPPQKSKSKAFRKPFQAYAAPDARLAKRAEIQKQDSISVSRAPSPAIRNTISRAPSPQMRGYTSRVPSPAPPIHNIYGSRAPSPAPPTHDNAYGSRAPSPAPPLHYNSYGSRAPSPAPPMHTGYGYRAPSPAPSFQNRPYSRAASSNPEFDLGSSPPPPPPPHRSAFTPHKPAYSPRSSQINTPRAPSPCPPSPGATGLTPSPLRSAMDDVMSSLYDMGISRETESPEAPLDPWSPEAFDQTYIKARRNNKSQRPNTAMGIGGQNDYDDELDEPYVSGTQTKYVADQPPPQLSNYVRRMEDRLNKMHTSSPMPLEDDDRGPAVPPKLKAYDRPKSVIGNSQPEQKLRHRKSAYEVGRSVLGRTFTTKTNSTSSSSGNRSTTTNGSSSTQMTDRSIMSGPSASAFSSTSAGSLARKKEALQGRSRSAFGSRREQFLDNNGSQADFRNDRPQTPLTGISYHSSHASGPTRPQSQAGWQASTTESGSMLGGLVAPKPKKTGFFKKIIESAKTGAASARSSIAVGETSRPVTSSKNTMPTGLSSIGCGYGGSHGGSAANDMGLSGGGIDWVQVRRDVNRSNSLSRIERVERKERCQMMDYPAISPVEELFEGCDGDEGADGNPVPEPTNFQAVNLSLVDKNARFINSLPPMTNPISLATGFVCRPYRSDVQRLRAIFTWVSEKVIWEDDFETEVDARRVIQTKRGCAEEVAVLVLEMCAAVGIHAEVVRGYLKTPGEVPELGIMPRPNHWWNAVLVDGEWRIMDCSLAAPSNPRRALYSSTSGQSAESWWFLARPTEVCWTHIPERHDQQHMCPAIAHEVLLALPCACPPYFKNALQMTDYDTSLIRIDDLELVHIKFTAPADVECVAEVEARGFERDADGDFFESGDVVKKRALAQAEWIGGQKRYTVKALLPGDEGQGILKIYAGKRGLMHSIKDIPHPLALALPIIHTGDNPPYEFLTRHPTPHAQRHDLYVAQPQCQHLALNNTFVFAVRQHPSSTSITSPNPGGVSPIPFIRPSSAMSITNSSASGSNPSSTNAYASKKPAKLAIQAPGGKVLRLMRKEEKVQSTSQALEKGDGGTWETIIKVGERGVWRGLILEVGESQECAVTDTQCIKQRPRRFTVSVTRRPADRGSSVSQLGFYFAPLSPGRRHPSAGAGQWVPRVFDVKPASYLSPSASNTSEEAHSTSSRDRMCVCGEATLVLGWSGLGNFCTDTERKDQEMLLPRHEHEFINDKDDDELSEGDDDYTEKKTIKGALWIILATAATLTGRRLLREADLALPIAAYPIYFTLLLQITAYCSVAVIVLVIKLIDFRKTKRKSLDETYTIVEVLIVGLRLCISACSSAVAILCAAEALMLYDNLFLLSLLSILTYVSDSFILILLHLARITRRENVNVNWLSLWRVFLVSLCIVVAVCLDYRLNIRALSFALASFVLFSLSKAVLKIGPRIEKGPPTWKSPLYTYLVVGIPLLLITGNAASKYENVVMASHIAKSWSTWRWIINMSPGAILHVLFTSSMNSAYPYVPEDIAGGALNDPSIHSRQAVRTTTLVFSILMSTNLMHWVSTASYNRNLSTWLDSPLKIDTQYRPPFLRTFEIIIAHSAEDPQDSIRDLISAYTAVRDISGFNPKVIVYTKNQDFDLSGNNLESLRGPFAGELVVQKLKNIGGTTATYLHHILSAWDRIPQQMLFLSSTSRYPLEMSKTRLEEYFTPADFPLPDSSPKTGFLHLGKQEHCWCGECKDSLGWEDTWHLVPSMWGAARPASSKCEHIVGPRKCEVPSKVGEGGSCGEVGGERTPYPVNYDLLFTEQRAA
ncbi:hypothetical protein G7Y89_g4341 [Cudoniella acicularis]|uniref:SH3 domain-containing protein n=1 Tax=Cudoniella acicularis TaxID=354080 RepID=A0A8H4RR30_9HELO|nr:hypothetical protein G7Y89_g4341 [Cudoniella acicularis]